MKLSALAVAIAGIATVSQLFQTKDQNAPATTVKPEPSEGRGCGQQQIDSAHLVQQHWFPKNELLYDRRLHRSAIQPAEDIWARSAFPRGWRSKARHPVFTV